MAAFTIEESCLIPLESGHSVTRGWPPALGRRPLGVTWHWTVTRDLVTCRRVLGGANAEKKGVASAHYGIGRTLAEGVDRYVTLSNRSWHAGKNQLYRWDGEAYGRNVNYKGSRSTVGIEVVHMGHATPQRPPRPGWTEAASPLGRRMQIEPWPDEQLEMCVAVGKEIVSRWPHIRPDDHHGHHDLCPTYKVDVAGFPFARVLRGIYDDDSIPDVWTPLWSAKQRQKALLGLGYDLGHWGADGDWGQVSDLALRRFQRDHGMVVDGLWTTFTNRRVYAVLKAKGEELAAVTA
jgi:N-acetyl-anhydromuramyl-L-alanine amidase AmpD